MDQFSQFPLPKRRGPTAREQENSLSRSPIGLRRPDYGASIACKALFNPKQGARKEKSSDKGAEFPPRNNPAFGD
jgi:hypothetical protein